MKTAKLMSFAMDTGVAFVLLTRWPMPHLGNAAYGNSARAVWAYPVAGAAVGCAGVAAGFAAMAAGLPAAIVAGLVLAVMIISTGAMHEDGLADTADGLWGGHDREQRLEIMRDSHIGSYGTLALILTLGLNWSAISVVLSASPAAVIAVACLSRAVMPIVMYALPHARTDGLSHGTGRPALTRVVVGLAVAFAIAVLTTGVTALGALTLTILCAFAMCRLAGSKIGGQTGDILGATQQIAGISALCYYAVAPA